MYWYRNTSINFERFVWLFVKIQNVLVERQPDSQPCPSTSHPASQTAGFARLARSTSFWLALASSEILTVHTQIQNVETCSEHIVFGFCFVRRYEFVEIGKYLKQKVQ